MWRAVLGAAVVWAMAAPLSFAATWTDPRPLCAGYTVVKRAYPPSLVPTALVVKCPVRDGWKDWLVVNGLLSRCNVVLDKRPRDLTVTCGRK